MSIYFAFDNTYRLADIDDVLRDYDDPSTEAYLNMIEERSTLIDQDMAEVCIII
jgi:hypothetical protein